jgi:hypothetical protein
MKFYVEITPLFKAQRRAHIVKDENGSNRRSLCLAPLNPQKWILVAALPENIQLCKNCNELADFPKE